MLYPLSYEIKNVSLVCYTMGMDANKVKRTVDTRAQKDPRVARELNEMRTTNDLRQVDDDVEDIATLFAWEAPEHIHQIRNPQWFAVFAGVIALICIAFVFMGNFIASLTIAMIGGYIFVVAQHKPSLVRYRLLTEGVALGTTLYHYKHIDTFNIVYEPGDVKTVILKSDKRIMPLIHMEIGNADPVAIREILVQFVKEDVHLEEPIIDIWARRLGL